MDAEAQHDLAASLIVAPAGAALLAQLEAEYRRDRHSFWECPPGVDPAALDAAIHSLSARTDGDLFATAVRAAQRIAGPWSSSATTELPLALRFAPRRARLAEAIVERLSNRLSAPLDRSRQEWWWYNRPLTDDRGFAPLGGPRQPYHAWVTATPDGLWTVTAPEGDLADPLVDAWELIPPTSRWKLHIQSGVRVFEVVGPEDWQRLVTSYPLARADRPNSSWEFPGWNRYHTTVLEDLPGQRAMRSVMRYFVEPEWNAVARDWDAVHLTWGGFLTTEGLVIDLPDGDVAMLRNWCSERTLWLNPVLSNPEPLPAPPLSGAIDNNEGVDVRVDESRAAQDRAWLAFLLPSARS